MNKQLQKITLFFKAMADYGVSCYIFLMLGILPFYFTQGYSRIGTDKAVFFKNVNQGFGKLLVLLALCIFMLETFAVLLQKKSGNGETEEEQTLGVGFYRRSVDATDVFMLLYGLSQVLAYSFSDYKEAAWMGAKGWFMGFFTQIALVLIYFLVSRLWKPRAWMLYLVFPVSAAVFLMGYLNRYGFPVIEMESRSAPFISTIGNINWYCGYVVSVFFGGIALFWGELLTKSWQKLLLMAYIALGFATLMTQGSESGVLTAGVILLILFFMSAKDAGKMLLFWQVMTLLSGACLVSRLLRTAVGVSFAEVDGGALRLVTTGWFSVIALAVSAAVLLWVWKRVRRGAYSVRAAGIWAWGAVAVCLGTVLLVLALTALNTVSPGSIGRLSDYPLFTFSPAWASNRGATWGAAWMSIRQQDFLHRLVGIGPDAMSTFMYQDGSQGLRDMLRKYFGDATLTNAHNEWLTILLNSGVVGFVGFVGAMLSGIAAFFRKGKKNALFYSFGFCLLAYTINNMFSFQQTINVVTIFVIWGMGEAFLKNEEKE